MGRVSTTMRILRSKAPLRISFAGGGTDVSPYPEEKGGAVLNCTIDKFAFVTLEAVPDGGRDYRGRVPRLQHDAQFRATFRPGLQRRSRCGEGGSQSSSARCRNAPCEGLAPLVSAFGRSSRNGSRNVVDDVRRAVGAFQHYLREPWTLYEVAELVYRIEREELGLKGGRQDQYAAAFGGFNFIEFSGAKTVVNPLRIDPEVMNELAYRLLLCYTGTGHYSNDIIERQQRSYLEKRVDTVTALDATKRLAVDMKNELLRGNLDEMGRLLDEGWQHKKQFTEGISNERIDSFYTRAREAGALGGKLLGAGGGGYILLFCDVARRAKVAKAVQAAGGRVSDFSLEMEGLQTWSVVSPS